MLMVIVFIALVFDFINGFHDAANSIATVVSTRVLSPLQAVALAAGSRIPTQTSSRIPATRETVSRPVRLLRISSLETTRTLEPPRSSA